MFDVCSAVGGAPASYKATPGNPVAFVIPSGFKGSWETVEPLKKYYACYQAKL